MKHRPTERARRLTQDCERTLLHPSRPLTPLQRAEVTRELLAKGWRRGQRRPRPAEPLCWDCGEPVPDADPERPETWICDDCGASRGARRMV